MATAQNPSHKWRRDDDGNALMPEVQQAFLEWLINPMRTPETMEEYAEEIGVDSRTLRRWKRDPRFVKEWRAKAEEANVSPERTQAVVDNLWKVATGNSQQSTKAAELYLKYVQLFIPQQKITVEDASIDRLSDEDLAKLAGFADAK